ncbi:FAD-linked reductase [Setomelanomma holmii]|uniref:FAD-linked reductase n=1 Tax=Setomelanomma holmii TaxID=210430 RepID=A0A9P4LJS0_9PLEO|nr:FAD-linked reductase [Setomelanomma holmii]
MNGLSISIATATLVSRAAYAQTSANQNYTAFTFNVTYDYFIIGSGAGDIPVADRLSEAGHSALLIEKEPPSRQPKWLEGTNLTRFEVPGLFNQIWADPASVACDDLNVMTEWELGGGVAVNFVLWWKPHRLDWDVNFPAGWTSSDMQKHVERVWERLPGTSIPSQDGKLYLQQGFDTKNHTYGHSTFILEHAERHGPLATYLVTAAKRKNFHLWTNRNARRLNRTGGHVTGVELECSKGGSAGPGYASRINVTPGTGRVIVSAGTFGSAKLLMRSGIGPADQLKIVNNSATDGPTMISSNQWINLPVGYNVNDHVDTDIQIAHQDIPIAKDTEAYLANRTDILAQVAPNLGPMFWQQILGSDGVVRHIISITQYLGIGTTSRSRMAITPALTTRISIAPYLRDQHEKEAVVQGIEYIRGVLSQIQNLTWIAPSANQTTTAFVNSIPATPGSRGSNHWTGSCKIGADDGRAGWKAVLDLDTKVYGTDNLFVVDASIFRV